MATEEAVPSANEVAAAFVDQYYHIMGNMPHEANKFYVDSSVVSRPGPDATMMSFTSVEAIDKEFLSSEYKDMTYEVVTVDSHKSVEDGIFIMVIGLLAGKDNVKRKFSHMFYLARHKTVYVVFNDIFRFVDQPVAESEPSTEAAAEPIRKIDVNAVEKSITAADVKKVSEAMNIVAGANPPLDNGNKKHSDEKVVAAQKPKEPVAVTTQPDGAKKSFAAIVQSMAKSTAPFQGKAPVHKPNFVAQPRAATAPRAPAAVSKSEKKIYLKIVEEPGTSIFVANLPMTAMPPQLHELFKDFGPIRENGVQVRSNRAKEVCFGFVAFESATSVQSVLQAAKKNPFMLADRKLRVKEKEVDYDGSKPAGKTGGGSKTYNGSTDGSKAQNGSVDGNMAQNGSVDGGDDFVPAERKHRNRNRKNVGRTERSNNPKSSEGGAAPMVQQA